MGIMRGGLLIVVAVILFINLLLLNIFFTMSLSLGYENVQEELPPLIDDLNEGIVGETSGKFLGVFGDFDFLEFNLYQETDSAFDAMPEYCQDYDEYVFSFEGHTISLSCTLLEEGRDAAITNATDSFIEKIYYSDYDCNFWNCFKDKSIPFFLVSEKAKDYWKSKFYFTLVAFLILAILTFLLVEQKQNTLIFLGSFMVLSALPLLKLESFVRSISGKIFTPFIKVFFSSIDFVFWFVFILGLVFLIGGIVLRFFTRDFLKKKFSSKDVKNMIRAEIRKFKKDKINSDNTLPESSLNKSEDKVKKSVGKLKKKK